MNVGSLLDRLAATDPARCAAASDVASLVHDVQGVRAWLDAYEARCARRASELAAAGAGAPVGEVLADGGRRRGRDAAVAAARAEVLTDVPAFQAALEAGVVSAGHVDAVARAAKRLPEGERAALMSLGPSLVSAAVVRSVEAFERDCCDLVRLLAPDEGISRVEALRRQRRVRRWIDQRSGLHHTLLSIDPESDAKVAAALRAATADVRAGLTDPNVDWDHVQADALVGLITGARSLERRVPEVSVLIDLQTLETGQHDRSVSETSDGVPLLPEAIRRLACEADIVPIVLGGAGEVLDEGRGRRLATVAQRRAIKAMHATCVMPACTVSVDDCRIHHVDPWRHGGRTDLDLLVPVCERDHHRLHEGGWRLKITPDRRITVTRPDGVVVHDGPSVDRSRGPAP
jgi:HNH endonuclease